MCPVSDELLEAVKGTYVGFEARLRESPFSWTAEGLTVTGSFHYLTFRDGQPSLDEFVEFIYWKLIPFCIPRRERREKLQLLQDTGDERYMHELTDKAKHLFIKARQAAREKARIEGRDEANASGEPGELILFMLLEKVRKAPQIACKMYLKTSEQMPVHGSDGIHICRGDTPESLRFVWGESKLYGQLAGALDAICASISEFLAATEGRTHRDRDVDILKDHLDIEEPDWRQAIVNYFDPYFDESNAREEAFACFVGFDFTAYGRLSDLPPAEREAAFVQQYQERIKSACELFAEKITAAGLQHLRIDFFLMPFQSVSLLRRRFLAKIGVVE